MKQVINLSERELHRLINESVLAYLDEAVWRRGMSITGGSFMRRIFKPTLKRIIDKKLKGMYWPRYDENGHVCGLIKPTSETPLSVLRDNGVLEDMIDGMQGMPEEQQRMRDNANNPEYTLYDLYSNSLTRDLGLTRTDRPNWKRVVGILRMIENDDELNMIDMGGTNLKRFNKLMKICDFINRRRDNEVDADFNGMSFNELENQYGDAIAQDRAEENDWLNANVPEGDSDYRVERIDTFEQAHQYTNYCEWCICGNQDQFTGHVNGGNQFYFFLKDGFENIPREQGENCPLDEYGLSMIAVLIDPDGDVTKITTRWNHMNGGENNDGLYNKRQLQEITGLNVNQILQPANNNGIQHNGYMDINAMMDADRRNNPERFQRRMRMGRDTGMAVQRYGTPEDQRDFREKMMAQMNRQRQNRAMEESVIRRVVRQTINEQLRRH